MDRRFRPADTPNSRASTARALGVLFAIAVLLASVPATAGSVHPDLEAQLATLPPGGFVPVIVELTTQEDPAAAASRVPAVDRRARGRAVVDALRDVAARTQPAILALLANEQALGNARNVTPFWVFNGLAVTATEPVIRRLAARADVRELRLDAAIPPPVPTPAAAAPAALEPVWNIAQIRAPEVWAIDPRFTGVGVVVGSFDTGVDGTHPDLAPRYRGDHAISWFDPYGQHTTPYDANGHGTHTTGTAVGGDASGNSIGVAPGARWIAAKAWSDSDEGATSAFHQIFQWFLAPGGDPANAPDVVNSSWGLTPSTCFTEFRADVQALRAAGIVPVFASGNSGPRPRTALAPGSYAESFSVGATDFFDEIASFSSQGPSPCDGAIKPDISAPGVFILSTVPGGYAGFDGTSMAAPHVTGAAAVLRSIVPDLTVDEVESALLGGAVDLGPQGPDNAYGVGRLDLMESARIVLESFGLPLVGIAATTSTASEAGLVPGAFTVSRTGSTDADLTLTYVVTGTAIPGADYVALPSTVTIPAGATSVTVVVTPIDDSLVELDETVIVTLNSDPAYVLAPAQATVTIVSDEIPPDLVVSAMTAPSTTGAGASVTLTDTTRNQGAAPAAASATAYFLSADSALDAADVRLASRSVPPLESGASGSGSVTVTIPADTPVGTYRILAKADADNALVETQEGNNVLTRIVAIGADLVVSTLTTPTIAEAGATITVTDTTRNAGGGGAGASTTRFYFSTKSTLDASAQLLGSRAVPALAPAASDSGSVTLSIPAGTASGAYYVIADADGQGVVTETQESNNRLARSIQIGADLVISSFAAPTDTGAGLAITLTDTTRNAGGGSAGASTTRFYLSTNSAVDTSDVLLGSRAVPALAAGASNAGSVTITIPAGTATGIYFLIARADGGDAVAETSEANNTSSRTVRVGPDLTVTSLTAPTAAGAGTTISVMDTTRNAGGGGAGASTTRLYLSTNSVLDAADVLLGGRAVPALAPAVSNSGSVTLAIPAGTASGTYYLIADADGEGVVGETQESNNRLARSIQIGADLVISSFAAPTDTGAGLAITLTDTTRNAGGGTAGTSTTRFYLSTDPALDAADVLLGSRAVPALAAGASDAGSVTVTIPSGATVGTYYVFARADAAEAVAETSETNNTTSRTLRVGPDLTVTSLTAPTTAGAGTTISATDTTRNAGGGNAGASTTRFYLSTNSVLDTADVLLGARAVPALAPAVSDSGSVTLAIPAGTASGTYYLIADADGEGVIGETQESNNRLGRTIQVGADLAVSSFSAPSGTGPGATVLLTDTTRNAGGSQAGASTTTFYLSANSALDSSDVALGSRAVPALAAGASDAGSVTVSIPTGTATGTYYLIARADAGEVVAETSETNNTTSRTLQVGPDLTVTSLTAPTTAGAGTTISVTDTTRNAGGGNAGASTTRFYLSTNSALDTADVLLGGRAVPALAPAVSDSGSVTLAIPAGTASGTYYLIADADGEGVVGETQESNNRLTRSIQIGSDLVISSFLAPTDTGAGLAITLTDTTRNAGGSPAGASVTTFYLSTNSAVDASDVVLGSRAVPALAPGASDTGSATVSVPPGTATGTYFVIARADGGDAVVETTETNNTASRTVRVGPDLAISSFSAPTDTGAGAMITVTDTTRNSGGGGAGASVTTFYLSANSALDASDVGLGTRAVPALAAGASDAGSVTLTIPPGTATGTYYVFVRADAGDAVAETAETNNTSSRTLRVGPDLTITSLTAPTSAGAGATIAVTDTTRNAGGGAAGASTTRFYLSTNSALDTTDVLLGGRAVPALPPTTSDSGSVTLAIPAGTASGTYYLIADADGEGVVGETQESNNRLARSIQIGADLVISSFTAPTDTGAGLAIALTDTTRNAGGSAADASVTTFYLSTNSAVDVSDVVLGSRAVPPLAPGVSDTGSATVSVPPGTATGTYFVIARADGGDAVVETTETNNASSRTVRVGPDLTVTSLTAPTTAGVGATISVTDTARNAGGGGAGASTTRFYLSTNSVLDTADVLLGGRAVPALPPTTSDSGSVTLAIPAGTASGTYYLIADADGEGVVGETQESNNRLGRSIQITVDLIISSLAAPSDTSTLTSR